VSTPFGHLWTRRTAFLGIAVTIALSVAAVWFRRVQPQPVCCPGAGPAALNEPIAVDPRIRAETLANGLHYYIRPNTSPIRRVELRLVVNAGSVLEDDDQRGLAHGVEHMLLRGTRHFPGDAIESYFESIGMRRGEGVNATTSMDETIYRMTVPVDRPGAIDTALAMLADIARDGTFADADSRNEAKVVLEEWRSERDAFQRITDARHALIFAGTPYASRPVIGDTSILRKFDLAAMRRFYETWYRPDLMAVVAVGAFEAGEIEPIVTRYFSSIPRQANPRPRPPPLSLATPKTLRASILTDAEATDTWISFWYSHRSLPYKRRADYRTGLIAALWRSVLEARLEDASATADSPVVGTGVGIHTLARSLEAQVVSVVAMKDRAVAATETVAAEIERLAHHGVTQQELDERALAALRAARSSVEAGDAPGDLAASLVNHFLTGDAVVSNRAGYELTRDILPTITTHDLSAYAKTLALDSGAVVIAAATTDDPVARGSSDALSARALAAGARAIAPPRAEPNVAQLLARTVTPGRVAKEQPLADVRGYEWTLSNGMRVILKPTRFTFDKIQLRAVAPGGASLVPDADYPSAFLADAIIASSGVGDLTDRQLDRWLLTTSMSATLGVTNDGISVNGSTASRDLRSFFQLVHLYLTAPRSDTVAFRRYRDRLRSLARDRARDPDAVFDDTLSAALASNNPRLMRSVARFLESGSLTTAVDFWKERASNGAGFIVVITGDFTLDKMRPLVERYLGSIPSGAPEQPRDVGIPLVSGVVRREVDSGVSGTARAAIAMTGPLPTTHQAFERLELVRDLMQAAIEHRLRDELGGTYGVSVSLATSLAPPARYTMTVDFRAAAEHVEELAAAALREIERLRVNGPTEAEFDRARAARLQDYDGEIEDNDYWISELSSHARFGWPFGEIAEHPREVANLTLADLRGACASYISRGSYVRVTTRPHARATIAPPP